MAILGVCLACDFVDSIKAGARVQEEVHKEMGVEARPARKQNHTSREQELKRLSDASFLM